MNRQVEELLKMEPEKIQRLFHQVFNSEAGKVVLEAIRVKCYSYESTFSADPYEHARNAGRREVLLQIEAELQPIEPAEQAPQDGGVVNG